MTLVKWDRGGEATIVKIAGDAISVRSTVSAPPGSLLQGSLDLPSMPGEQLRMKAHGSKKQPDGSFFIEGRAIDMTRALRLALESSQK